MDDKFRTEVNNDGRLTITNNEDTVEFVNEFVELLNEKQELIKELYEFRLLYNACLFNMWHTHNVVEVYKSRRHDDGELCFDGEYFIVVALLPTGQITNHYPITHWELFKIPTYNKVKDKYDGHTSKDVLNRLMGFCEYE